MYEDVPTATQIMKPQSRSVQEREGKHESFSSLSRSNRSFIYSLDLFSIIIMIQELLLTYKYHYWVLTWV